MSRWPPEFCRTLAVLCLCLAYTLTLLHDDNGDHGQPQSQSQPCIKATVRETFTGRTISPAKGVLLVEPDRSFRRFPFS